MYPKKSIVVSLIVLFVLLSGCSNGYLNEHEDYAESDLESAYSFTVTEVNEERLVTLYDDTGQEIVSPEAFMDFLAFLSDSEDLEFENVYYIPASDFEVFHHFGARADHVHNYYRETGWVKVRTHQHSIIHSDGEPGTVNCGVWRATYICENCGKRISMYNHWFD